MKPLELTSEQKEHLLEMCKALFPEPKYSFWWEYEMYGRGLKQDFNDVLCIREAIDIPKNIGTKEKPFMITDRYFNIHWFEFCLKYIAIKLFDYKHFIDFCHIALFCSEKPHIIDYLYNEFKKLKL